MSTTDPLAPLQDFLLELVTNAGRMALDYHHQAHLSVHFKSARDLVTEADKAIEKYLVGAILARYPTHAIYGEESGRHEGREFRWIIDPIDGTSSFVHHQPFFSISIAVEWNGSVVLGAVNGPVLGELYLARQGRGATLNGQPIRVSTATDLSQCILSTGFACLRAGLPNNNLPYLCALLPRMRDMRRYGSAALDLCYVARGSLEGFWERKLELYDIAAGVLILLEAGGRVGDYSGGPLASPGEILASNGHIHDQVTAIFRSVQAGA